MPIKPKPYMLKCPSCRYIKVVDIKSDSISPMDMLAISSQCPRCATRMEYQPPSVVSLALSYIKRGLKKR